MHLMRGPIVLLLLSLFSYSPVQAYKFSKSGDASARWKVDVERTPRKPDWSLKSKNLPGDVTAYANTVVESSTVRELSLPDGVLEASRTNKPIELTVEYGLRELLEPVSGLRGAGGSQKPPSSGHKAPGAPSVPETSVEVPPQSDASIIVIKENGRMAVEGLLSELTLSVDKQTRGFVFPMPKKPCSEEVDGKQFPDNKLSIPEDAASFVIPSPGVQTVDLSHPILCSTSDPLVIVMEHVDSGRGRFDSMSNTCPLKVVRDSSTADLNGLASQVTRQNPGLLNTAQNGVSGAEALVGQIYGGKFDELEGAYQVLTHRFSQPHTLVAHLLLTIGELTNVGGRNADPSILQVDDVYKMVIAPTDRLAAENDVSSMSTPSPEPSTTTPPPPQQVNQRPMNQQQQQMFNPTPQQIQSRY